MTFHCQSPAGFSTISHAGRLLRCLRAGPSTSLDKKAYNFINVTKILAKETAVVNANNHLIILGLAFFMDYVKLSVMSMKIFAFFT